MYNKIWEEGEISNTEKHATITPLQDTDWTFQTSPLTFDVKKSPTTNMPKCSMWKPKTNNESLPTRMPTLEGQQKEIQYPG